MEGHVKHDCAILANVQESIRSFDKKAGILVSIIGIVFGLSLTFLSFYPNMHNLLIEHYINQSIFDYRTLIFSIFYGIYFACSLISILLCLSVFYPHKNKKNADQVNINYYRDLANMDFEQYEENKHNWLNDQEIIWKQISVNAKICKRKHLMLQLSIISFVFHLVLFVALVGIYIGFMR